MSAPEQSEWGEAVGLVGPLRGAPGAGTAASRSQLMRHPLGGLNNFKTSIYVYLGEIEPLLYNSHEKNNRFTIFYIEDS